MLVSSLPRNRRSNLLYSVYLGELKEIDVNGDLTDTGFKFDVYKERAKNQERYEQIGAIIDQEVYRLLETEAGLERVEVGEGQVKSFVFCSPKVKEASKVVLLIHGSGVVRAGQWARRLIINNVRPMLVHLVFYCFIV